MCNINYESHDKKERKRSVLENKRGGAMNGEIGDYVADTVKSGGGVGGSLGADNSGRSSACAVVRCVLEKSKLWLLLGNIDGAKPCSFGEMMTKSQFHVTSLIFGKAANIAHLLFTFITTFFLLFTTCFLCQFLCCILANIFLDFDFIIFWFSHE